ncbi:MAG TPA: vWA domain-containing protein, partial [Acidimicrobiia bacterium]
MRRASALVVWVALLLGVFGVLPAFAQETQAELEITDVITLRYPAVQTIVELRNVAEVDPAQLVLLENGETVTDATVERVSETTIPVGIVLTIDISGSMAEDPLEEAKNAARSFVQQKREQDYVAIVAFSDKVEIRSGFTNSQPVLLQRIDELQATGGTALYDAVVLSAAMYSGDAERLQRNMILLTDGGDTDSLATLEEALQAISDRSVRTFAVALESEEFNVAPLQALVTTPEDLLTTTDPAQLSALYGEIQAELDNTLVVRWQASQTQAGDLEVQVSYGSLSDGSVVSVPGFIPEGYTPPDATTDTFPEAVPYQVTSAAPFDLSLLRLAGTAAVVVATAVLVMILIRPQSEEASSSFRTRLQAYGRGRGESDEERRGLAGRLGFLKVFTERAEQV